MMRRLLLVILLLAVSGCQTRESRDGVAINAIREASSEAEAGERRRSAAPPPEVAAALMPPMQIELGGIGGAGREHRFDVNVSELAARDFFLSLVDGTTYNMVVHPAVVGQVSLVLKNVTIPEVMQVMRDVYGYEYERTRSGFHVLPVRMQTRIYQVHYLNVKRTGNSEMRVSSGQVTQVDSTESSGVAQTNNSSSSQTVASSKVVTESESDFWTELRSALELLVGNEDGRSIVVSPQSGVIVVRAMPNELREVESFLRTTQSTLQRQVILEAKIMEVALSDAYQAGINWSKIVGLGGGETVTFGQGSGSVDPSLGVVRDIGGVFSIAVDAGSFTAMIELLETQGNVQVLSSPRVSTVNNQKAVIKVGQDEYFITDVSTTTVTGTATSTTPDVTLTPFFSGIALDVTPQIDNRGGVTLHIHPSVSDVEDQTKTFTIDDKVQTLPTAQSSIRESDSIVYAVSGQIVVIGGLMQEQTGEDVAATPVLGDIPFLGSAFRQTRQLSRKSELVILLKPMVVDTPSGWSDPIAQSDRRFEALDRGFHVGGKPEVFGTEAEMR